ncbi:MAG TPA: acetyl-CoA carboxylase biotin carboxyl carrier protein [Accumulibacter sp.]|jgi:acetyl-CoA carboxylase biotin carboxyl carrier protein|nr:acetyl-CoA carboxylase biotin carboxyl carrier protein [Accumulibacter sp.]HPP46284.1 acetyl-CoA carboxylase biotin carboxyl carrier protein [Accumulibacter sp.]
MDLRKLKKLIEMVEESSITELEINDAEEKVRIVKYAAPAAQHAFMVPAAPPPSVTTANANPALPQSAATAELPEGEVIKAPMVGTFYRAANPGAEPFVQVGSVVKVSDTLCIIEAMKLLNNLDAEIAGTIKAILVENGQPVEYGEPLFVIG